MARLSKLTVLGFTLGWLFVAALMTMLGWISYRRLVQPWEKLDDCRVVKSEYTPCGEESMFRVVTTVTFKGQDEPIATDDGSCIYKSFEEAEKAFVEVGPITCYESPTDPPQITVFKEVAEKDDGERRYALFVTVTPLVVTCFAAAVMFFVIFRLRAVIAHNDDDSIGGIGFLSSLFGPPVPPRPAPRGVPSRGVSESDANAAVADIARTVDSCSSVCVVCLEENTDKSVELPCTHAFHESCLKAWWMKGNPVCPCCSKTIAELRGMRNGASLQGMSDVDEESGLPPEAPLSEVRLPMSSSSVAIVASSSAMEPDPIVTAT